EKQNERVQIPLTPEEPKTPYVKPINQFVLKADDNMEKQPEPLVKPTGERSGVHSAAQQADLFSTSSSIPQLRNNTPDGDGIIRHTLTPESEEHKETEADETPNDGYEVRTTPSAFHFELPTTVDEEPNHDMDTVDGGPAIPNPVDALHVQTEMNHGADEHKTPEHVQKELLKTKERILRLKELSMKLKSANGLQELETEPAYRRKQMALDDVPHSSESQVSRFTLSTEDGITDIRPNNSFWHDNVY